MFCTFLNLRSWDWERECGSESSIAIEGIFAPEAKFFFTFLSKPRGTATEVSYPNFGIVIAILCSAASPILLSSWAESFKLLDL